MVVVCVSQNNGIQPPNTAREQIWRDDVLADRKCTFVSQVEKSSRSDAAAVDEHPIARREFDQDRIALSDIQKGQRDVCWRLGRKIHETHRRLKAYCCGARRKTHSDASLVNPQNDD